MGAHRRGRQFPPRPPGLRRAAARSGRAGRVRRGHGADRRRTWSARPAGGDLAEGIERSGPGRAGSAEAREAARFLLLNPPLPLIARPPYGVLAAAAVSLLPRWARRPLLLPALPLTEAAVVGPAGQAVVRGIRWATTSPARQPQG